MGTEKEKEETTSPEKKNILEWVVFAVGVILTLTTVGYLTIKAITHNPGPAEIVAHYSPSPSEKNPYRYKITVENNGGETAEEVMLEVILHNGGNELEKSEIRLPFVPQVSRRESWVNFSHNPKQADSLTIRVLSFRKH